MYLNSELPEDWLTRAPVFSVGQLPAGVGRYSVKVPEVFLTDDALQGVVVLLCWRLPEDAVLARTYMRPDRRLNQVVQSGVRRYDSWEFVRMLIDHDFRSVPRETATLFVRDLKWSGSGE